MSEQWGPWIEHDGKGCPCVGKMVEVVEKYSGHKFLIAGAGFDGTESWTGSSWHWALIQKDPTDGVDWDPIIRYRVRKPRALLDLIERARELDDAPQGHVRVPGKEVVG